MLASSKQMTTVPRVQVTRCDWASQHSHTQTVRQVNQPHMCSQHRQLAGRGALVKALMMLLQHTGGSASCKLLQKACGIDMRWPCPQAPTHSTNCLTTLCLQHSQEHNSRLMELREQGVTASSGVHRTCRGRPARTVPSHCTSFLLPGSRPPPAGPGPHPLPSCRQVSAPTPAAAVPP